MAIRLGIILIILASSSSASSKLDSRCFDSIISFGDSLADTGNCPLLSPANTPPRSTFPPYGRTFFHYPTGRFSDGRLVIDFIAQSLGLPLVEPYIAGATEGRRRFSKGVNFAVDGATALDYEYYEKMGILNPNTNVSLGTQLDWFKQFLATIPDGKKFLQKSLVLLGEIGGNDYNHPLEIGMNPGMIQSFVTPIVNYIGSTLIELINLGAETILVPGNLPIGCLPIYLTQYKTRSTANDYDPKTGCLSQFNEFARYHNVLLKKELSRIQELYPHVVVIYADYYNAAIRLYLSPNEFGFTKEGILRACCGAGGPYNYNETTKCGSPAATSCDDPSTYANWDGIHMTEAAYKLIAQGLLQGPYTTPHFTTVCPSIFGAVKVYEL